MEAVNEECSAKETGWESSVAAGTWQANHIVTNRFSSAAEAYLRLAIRQSEGK